MNHAGVLLDFAGVAVHDGWAAYRNYSGREHVLCNIHHVRELQAASEAGHTWPVAMSALLLDTKTLVEHLTAAGKDKLTARQLRELADSYKTIIAIGHDEHPATPGKKTKAHNLLLRLERDQADVLRFAHDFTVPFGNNQGEQDIRMIKLQQKISGCWRTHQDAVRFLTIRGYLSTARKHGHQPLDVLMGNTPSHTTPGAPIHRRGVSPIRVRPKAPQLNQLTAGRPWLPDPAHG